MKISSASKKVLASALSAAMVVAFAPTVAFGAVAVDDTVYLQFDTSKVTVKDANAALQADPYTVVIETANKVKVPDLTGHAYQFDKDTPVAQWYVDLNDNDKNDDGVFVAANAATGVLDFSAVAAKITPGATVTLKPAAAAAVIETSEPDTIKQKYAAGDPVNFTVKNNDTTAASHDLRVALLKDGKEIAYTGINSIAAATNATTPGTATATFNFVADDTASNLMNSNDVKVGTWGKGTYSLQVVDKDTFKTVATAEWKVVEVSLEGVFGKDKAKTNSIKADETQYGQTILAIAGKSVESQLTAAHAEVDVAALKVVNDAAVLAAEYTVDGKTAVEIGYTGTPATPSTFTKPASLTNSVKVAEGMVLTPAYADVAQVGKPTFTAAVPAPTKSNDLLKGEVKYTKNTAEYVIAVSGAATAEKKVTGDGSTISNILLIDFGSAGAAAGTYTVTVTEITDKGTNQEKSTVIGSQSITLTEVTIDRGEGSTVAGTNAQTSKSTVVSTTKVADVIPTTAPTAKTGYRFVGWSLDGTNVVKGTELVGESAVTLKAVYASTVAEAPTFSYENGMLTLVNNAGSNYELKYIVGTGTPATPYTGPITLDVTKNATVEFQAFRKTGVTTGALNSAKVAITSYKTSATTVENWAKAAVAEQTGASTAAKPQVYSEALTTVVADAKAAITALNYGTAADWAKAELAQKTAVLKAIADYENAQIDALVAGAKQADGTVKKLAETTAAKQKEAIAAVVADFGYNNDLKADGTPDGTTKGAGTYASTTAAGDYVKAIAKASKAALDGATSYKAEDVAAAEAVAAQLKAAKTGAEAKAAIEAYGKLSNAAKELVPAADIAAAQEIVAAAELKDAQDDAAVSKARNASKTVKAGKNGKTTKKQSVTLKAITSKSGAKVTYKKSSGSSKVSVKSGKAYLAKGVKKGTYKATVKATCGTQTAKIKVTFKVK